MISIIIPTYNRRELLVRAVQSVFDQTFQDWELIVVDDGSQDGSCKALSPFQGRRFRYVYQKHRGVSAARNLGIRLARFDWIAFLDSDDYWLPRKLQRQLERLEECPHYRIIYTGEIWMRRGTRVNPKRIHQKHSGWIYHRCLPLCIISPSSVLLHRQLLRQNGMFDEGFPVCEDYELWLRISARHPVLFLNESLIVKTGGHSDQLSRSTWGMDRYRIRALEKTYQSGILTPQQRTWTAREIVRKALILLQGFRKRGKHAQAEEYRQAAARWEIAVASLPYRSATGRGAK